MALERHGMRLAIAAVRNAVATVRRGANLVTPPYSTLLVGKTGLEQAKQAIRAYKEGKIPSMTPELWKAKKIVDSTIHPGLSQPPPPSRPHL